MHDTLALNDRTLGIYKSSQPCFIHSYVHSPAPRCNMIHLYQSYLYCKEGCGVGVACPWNAYYARSRRRACLMPASSPPCRTQPVKPLQGQNDQNPSGAEILLTSDSLNLPCKNSNGEWWWSSSLWQWWMMVGSLTTMMMIARLVPISLMWALSLSSVWLESL